MLFFSILNDFKQTFPKKKNITTFSFKNNVLNQRSTVRTCWLFELDSKRITYLLHNNTNMLLNLVALLVVFLNTDKFSF